MIKTKGWIALLLTICYIPYTKADEGLVFLPDSQEINAVIVKAQQYRLLKSDGTLWAWGFKNSSTFPCTFSNSEQNDALYPVEIETEIIDYYHTTKRSYYIKTDGSLWGWGKNYNDYSSNPELEILGDGSKTSKTSPVLIANEVEKFIHDWHSGILKSDNSLWMWGCNRMGQIGKGSSGNTTSQLSPMKIMDDVKDFDIGAYHTVALKNDGSVWVWGNSLGCGNANNVTSPLKKMTGARYVAAGTYTTYVIKNDNTLWAFGYNEFGTIGDGTTTTRLTPTKIMENVMTIDATKSQCAAIKTDGTLWRWGDVGNGVDGSFWKSPTKVLNNVKQVLLSNTNIRALKNDGTLWSAGSKPLGDGTENNGMELRKILDNVDEILSMFFVRDVDGALWAWGSMIGDGTNTKHLSPRKVMEGAPAKSKISDIHLADKTNAPVFSLSGQRLTAPKKGINIVGGKKVIIK